MYEGEGFGLHWFHLHLSGNAFRCNIEFLRPCVGPFKKFLSKYRQQENS